MDHDGRDGKNHQRRRLYQIYHEQHRTKQIIEPIHHHINELKNAPKHYANQRDHHHHTHTSTHSLSQNTNKNNTHFEPVDISIIQWLFQKECKV